MADLMKFVDHIDRSDKIWETENSVQSIQLN